MENEQLKVLATAAGKEMSVISKVIIDELIKREIIFDNTYFYGCDLIDVYGCDLKVSEIIEIIQATGIKTVKCEHFNAFVELVLLGDYDCPVCGGEMKVEDGEYEDVFTDMLTEPYVKVIWEEKKCSVCGHREMQGQEE